MHGIDLAWMRLCFFSAVATADDYALCNIYTLLDTENVPAGAVDLTGPSNIPTATGQWSATDAVAGAARRDTHTKTPQPPTAAQLSSWQWCSANYSDERTGTGSTAVLGPPDVVEVLAPNVLPYFQVLAQTNLGGRSWAVTAVGLFLTALPMGLIKWMSDAGWFHLPLISWPTMLKRMLNSIRRTCSVHPSYGLTKNDILLLRKLPNLAAREKIDADWQAEFHRRTVNTPVHTFPMPDGSASRAQWLLRLQKELDRLTGQAVDLIMSTARLESWDDWWASRAKWAPKGSSNSHGAVQDKLKADGMELSTGARAGKRSLMATIGKRSAISFLSGVPRRFPRASTKHEPGMKNRALYAIDDNAFTVASFPSVAVEKYINFDGIYAQQSPVDVANWVRNHIIALEKKLFVMSIDYSDFNSDHETLALVMHDLAWGKAWISRANRDSTAILKAACSIWTALSHLDAWVRNPETDELTRIFGGLFSGDRNTARDNSMLHAAYSRLMVQAAGLMIGDFELIAPAYTGDDEDAQFKNWTQALFYLSCHYAASFALTAHKQMAGATSHEYLQRVLTDDIIPRRPLAAALAQLCSGNWYQTNYVWFDGIIQSVNDNLWELHTRGMPLTTCRTLAKRVLNRAMKVRSGEEWVKLEWWEYRTTGSFSPLWGCVSKPAPTVELGESAVGTVATAPGVDAWVAKATRRFPNVMTDAKKKMYVRSLQRDCYGEMFAKERNMAMHQDAHDVWPRRSAKNNDPPVGGGEVFLLDDLNLSSIRTLLLGGIVERHPRTETELISRYGIDPQLYAMIGGKEGLLKSLTPAELSQWESIVELAPVPLGWHWLDPALRSWACGFRYIPASARATSGHKVKLPRWQQPVTHMQRQVCVVYACNGSGKTTAARRNPDMRILDMDDLIRLADAMQHIKRCTLAGNPLALYPLLVARLAQSAVELDFCVLTTQYPWPLVAAILYAAGIVATRVVVLMSDAAEIEQRMVDGRFWTPEKVQRRLSRFDKAASGIEPPTSVAHDWDQVLQLCRL